LHKDEVLIAWKLDRLSCSLKDTLPLMDDGKNTAAWSGGRRLKLKIHQQQEFMHLVNSEQKSVANAARLFNVHPLPCRVSCKDTKVS